MVYVLYCHPMPHGTSCQQKLPPYGTKHSIPPFRVSQQRVKHLWHSTCRTQETNAAPSCSLLMEGMPFHIETCRLLSMACPLSPTQGTLPSSLLPMLILIIYF